ncbi:MAG: serine/threonine-protein kinase [Candidatus Sumerlaeia bacterium]|nr:serine/threonine-protein kinase [Candidatus Sumerlaeia bacterium]
MRPPSVAMSGTLPSTIAQSRWAGRLAVETPGGEAEASGLHRKPEEPSDYRMVRKIAQGGMGEVWEAVQESLDRVVAVKRVSGLVPREESSLDSRLRILADFRREAILAARLEHPNILPVHDYDLDQDGNPILVMKLVRGRSWAAQIADDWSSVDIRGFLRKHLRILEQVCHAAEFAHSRGVVHRDLKPTQVMVGEFDEVLLMDWGLAMSILPADESGFPEFLLATRETAQNPAGTPALMAPEQTLPTAEGVGPWTDVYLLGGTLFYLLTGRFPHGAPTSASALLQAARGAYEWPPESETGRPIPQELRELVDDALAFAPAERPSGARAIAQRLESYLSAESRRAESVLLASQALDWMRHEEDDAALVDAEKALRDAEALWPANEVLPALRRRAAELRAGLAVARGDLVTAELLVPQIKEPLKESELRRRIASIRRDATAKRRQFITALAGCAILASLLALGAWTQARRERYAAEKLLALNSELLAETDLAKRNAAIAFQESARANKAIGHAFIELAGDLDLRDDSQRNLLAKTVRLARTDFESNPMPAEAPEELRRERISAMLTLGSAFARSGFPDDGLVLISRALDLAEEIGGESDDQALEALAELAGAAMWAGELTLADERLADLRARVARLPAETIHHFRLATLEPNPLQRAGRDAEARESLRLAIEIAGRLPGMTPGLVAAVHYHLVSIELRLKDHEAALAAIEEAERLYREAESGDAPIFAELAKTRGDVLLRLDRLDEAAAAYTSAEALTRVRYGEGSYAHIGAIAGLGRTAAARGDGKEGLALLNQAIGYAELGGRPLSFLIPPLICDAARVMAKMGDADGARVLYQRAITQMEADGEGNFARFLEIARKDLAELDQGR